MVKKKGKKVGISGKQKHSPDVNRVDGKKDDRSAATVLHLKMHNSRPKRNRKEKFIEHQLQSKELPSTRIQPDRRWFGNTGVVNHKELEFFREELQNRLSSNYNALLKERELAISLLNDLEKQASAHLLDSEPFEDILGPKKKRKRSKPLSVDYETLLNKVDESRGSLLSLMDSPTTPISVQPLDDTLIYDSGGSLLSLMDPPTTPISAQPLDDTPIYDSGGPPPSSCSSKKRGPSKVPSKLPDGKKRVISTNEYGQPNGGDADYKALVSTIGVLSRTHIPIIYKDFRNVPTENVSKVLDMLEESFDTQFISSSYLRDRIKAAWKNHKCTLHQNYIKGKDFAAVKVGPTPPNITREDWQQFVDICNSDEYKAASGRNAANRGKQVATYTLGRRSLAVVRHQLAKEKKCKSDAEVGRSEMYIRAHTKKDKTVQCPAIIEKIKEIEISNPQSKRTSVDDALSQTVGKDSRGRMRGIGGGVSMSVVKKTGYLMNKNENLQDQNMEITSVMAKIQRDLDEVKETLKNLTMPKGGGNIASQQPAGPSTQPCLQPERDVGKQCDMHGWPRQLVARGVVFAVDPATIVHHDPMGNGNYKIAITELLVPGALLFSPDGYHKTIGEVGVGGFVVWPRVFLDIQ